MEGLLKLIGMEHIETATIHFLDDYGEEKTLKIYYEREKEGEKNV